jgi:HK97 family phage prohead protease
VLGSLAARRRRWKKAGLTRALDPTLRGVVGARALPEGAIGLSFGYLVTKSHPEGDVRVLDEVDLFEVSLTPSPMNADTRVLSMKSMGRREPRRIASFDA